MLIVLYVGSQLLSSVLMSATADQNQRMIMIGLPFVFVVFIISFPAGLLVYWITTNIWTVGQQYRRAPQLGHRCRGRGAARGGGAAALSAEGGRRHAGGGGGAGAGGWRGRRRVERRRPRETRRARAAQRPPPPPPRKKKKRSGRRR